MSIERKYGKQEMIASSRVGERLQSITFWFGKIVHFFCWNIGRPLFKFFFDFKAIGEENLKDLKGPVILVFNHGSWLDPLFINASVPPSAKILPIHYATWYKHYYRLRPLLAMAGTFPVQKGIGLETTLKRGLEILNKGGTVGIAPEERRRHLGRIRKGRGGAAFLAVRTNSPILPIYIEGNIGLKTLASSIKNLSSKKVEVIIGKPFCLPSQSKDKELDLAKLSNLIMDKIYQLKNVR